MNINLQEIFAKSYSGWIRLSIRLLSTAVLCRLVLYEKKTLMDYPHWATRELLMNAICHRTYESNGPIQFYQYNDRIELMNPGGLYGKVNAQTSRL